jgi:hypothetical protein
LKAANAVLSLARRLGMDWIGSIPKFLNRSSINRNA